MRASFLILVVLALLGIQAHAGSPPKNVWFVFLTRGDGPRPSNAEELEMMQSAHIGNLKSNFDAGKLIIAGPLKDPSQVRRGITVMTVGSQKDVDACFTKDPYVQGKIMTVKAYRWDANLSLVTTKDIDPTGIAENRLVVIHAQKTISPASIAVHRKRFDLLGIISGRAVEPKEYLEFALFAGSDEAGIKSLLDADPIVKCHAATYEILPLWLAKGTLKPMKARS